MKETTLTMQVELTKAEADLLWQITLNARDEAYRLYGETPYLTDKLGELLNKLIFPDTSVCTVCKINPVNAEAGYDTCSQCLKNN